MYYHIVKVPFDSFLITFKGDIMKFNERLTHLRKRYSVSQTDLANAVGVSRKSIQYYESGERYPRNGVLIKLADYFNVTLEYLTSGGENSLHTSNSADALVSEVTALFSGGDLSEEDKDMVMRVIQEAYWDSKGIKTK